MPSGSYLTPIDLCTFLGVIHLQPNGYGLTILKEIERRTGSAPSAVYTSLDRLEAKGYLAARWDQPSREPDVRRRVLFTITPAGKEALRQMLQALDTLRAGTDLAGGEPEIVEAPHKARSDFTTTEHYALLGALRLHPNGYGLTIHDEIERQIGRAPPIDSLRATLHRLATQGYLAARRGPPTGEPGDRRRICYAITAAGKAALRQVLESLDALRQGTDLAAAQP
jgi:PadR family transcriptional regulator PadR